MTVKRLLRVIDLLVSSEVLTPRNDGEKIASCVMLNQCIRQYYITSQ